MTAPTMSSDVVQYLFGVRDALADLEPSERDDLLEELQSHLEELRAEDPDADLVQRLGSPSAYAFELRAAAGLPAPSRRRILSPADTVRDLQERALRLLRGTSVGVAVLEFVPQLRPAWWVLRAYGVLYLLHASVTSHSGAAGLAAFPFPQLGGSRVLGLFALLTVVMTSVVAGQRSRSWGARRRGWVLAGNVALVVLLLQAVGAAQDRSSYQNESVPFVAECCLTDGGGNTVTNVYAFDAEGRPIDRVQLFDQEGRPLNITGNGTEPLALHNVFPQQVTQEDYDLDGVAHTTVMPAPAIQAPRLPGG